MRFGNTSSAEVGCNTMDAMAPMRGLAPTATMSPMIATMAHTEQGEHTGHHGDEEAHAKTVPTGWWYYPIYPIYPVYPIWPLWPLFW